MLNIIQESVNRERNDDRKQDLPRNAFNIKTADAEFFKDLKSQMI